jgi:hypothetical protein
LQLAREPSGPYLAGGTPGAFDWDPKSLRVRLPIPAGTGPGHRVRVGLAMETPDATAFFNDAHRLLLGRANTLSTAYSSPELAKRSRLRLPEGYAASAVAQSPTEIDYEVTPPAAAVAGDWADLTLEADGAPLSRARLDLFPPLTVRLAGRIEVHFGQNLRAAAEPPTAPFDPEGGGEIEVALRNNSLDIQTYHLAVSGEGLEFLPPQTDLAVGALDERSVAFRVFGAAEAPPLRPWRLRVSGGASAELPMRALAVPRDRAVAWSADLDGDGSPEWVLESTAARAVFSSEDGGRWVEFFSKTAAVNFLPAEGAFGGTGPVAAAAAGNALVFTARDWKRTARLEGGSLTIEQTTPLPPDPLVPEKRGGATFSIERVSPGKVVYTLK